MNESLIEQLKKEVEAITEEEIKSFEPTEEAKKEEKIIGVLPIDLKKLGVLRSKCLRTKQEKINALINKIKTPLFKIEEIQAIEVEIEKISEKIDILNNIYWYDLKERFQLWDKIEISIYKGWKIAIVEKISQKGVTIIRIN